MKVESSRNTRANRATRDILREWDLRQSRLGGSRNEVDWAQGHDRGPEISLGMGGVAVATHRASSFKGLQFHPPTGLVGEYIRGWNRVESEIIHG
ncbi:MAG: hypothetical protein ACYTBZ_17500 [Planctomycetota bacterium]|jgi:hypothetical protein